MNRRYTRMACTLTEQVCDNRPKSAFINSDLRWHFRVKKTPHKTPASCNNR